LAIDNEKCWMSMLNSNGEEFKITTKSEFERNTYFLYKKIGDTWKRVSKNSDPSNFNKIVFGEID
jgi:ribosomal protein L32E